MSGQASCSRVLAVQRHRRQVARELGLAEWRRRVDGGLEWGAIESIAWGILDGSEYFDVHAAREHARSLIALEAEQGAFEDWTRVEGLGPENRAPGAFGVWCGTCEPSDNLICGGICDDGSGDVRGGWPGSLAAQWARQGGDRRAPMGRSLARLGWRILDALEGQPRECGHWTANDGQTMRTVIVAHVPTVIPCGCHGTGHNLRGVLPPIEWPASLRRKVSESTRMGTPPHDVPMPWTSDVEAMLGGFTRRDSWGSFTTVLADGTTVQRMATRVVPRGEHRSGANYEGLRRWAPQSSMPGAEDAADEVERVKHQHAWAVARMPRWRRGMRLHAEQRRERARDRELAAAALEHVHAWDRGTAASIAIGVASVLGCPPEAVTITEIRERHAIGVSVQGDYTGAEILAAAFQFAPATVNFEVTLPALVEALRVEGTLTV